MGFCVVSPDCGYGRTGTSQHHLAFCISCSAWGNERGHEVLKCFPFYLVLSMAIQPQKLVFQLKLCLGKTLTALNWWDWEIKPSEILIGAHIVSCFIFPKQVLGTMALFLEMRTWIGFPGTKMPSLISWSENFVFLSVANSNSPKNQVEGLPLLF